MMVFPKVVQVSVGASALVMVAVVVVVATVVVVAIVVVVPIVVVVAAVVVVMAGGPATAQVPLALEQLAYSEHNSAKSPVSKVQNSPGELPV
jgi:hypothetical protein